MCDVYMREPGRLGLGALPGAGAAPLNGRGVQRPGAPNETKLSKASEAGSAKAAAARR